MQIVIDINDKVYGLLRYFEKGLGLNDKKDDSDDVKTALIRAVINGTPLPKGHGNLIDKEELKENINGWYAFMKDICKQPYMTLKQEEIIGKIDIMTSIIKADKEQEDE